MNMLTSLKTLLFTTASAKLPGSGDPATGAVALGMDFAQLLDGSIADAVPTPLTMEAAQLAETENVPAAPVAPAGGEAPAASTAQAGSHPVWRDGDTPLPPGLALGLVKHAMTGPAAQSSGRPGAMATAAKDATATKIAVLEQETLAPEAAAPDSPVAPALNDALTKAERKVLKAEAKAEHIAEKAEPSEVGNMPPPDEPRRAEAAEKGEKAEPAPTVPLPLAVATPIVGHAPVDAAPAGKKSEAAGLVATSDRPKAAAKNPPIKAAPQTPTTEEGANDVAPETVIRATPPQSASTVVRQPKPPIDGKKSSAPVVLDPFAETPEPLPAASSTPAVVLNGQPVKAEALNLLQIVREQVAARQSGEPVHVGKQLSLAARDRAAEPAPPVQPLAPADPIPSQGSSLAAAPPQSIAPQVLPAAAPVADLSATIGSQVVDMGVSGQWIDGLARDIAGLSANGAQGRFHLNTNQLGTVQVDIRQGSEGAAVSLTVASEAAEMALRQDSDRLKIDAGLSAVRIAEVKIERAVHEPSRSDSTNQQGSQQPSQNSSHPQSAWQTGGQAMGQSPGQQGRWQGRENNGFGAKSSGDLAVLNHTDARREGSEPRSARYA